MSVLKDVINLLPVLLVVVAAATGLVTLTMPLLAGSLVVSNILRNFNLSPSALRLSINVTAFFMPMLV